MTAKTMKNIKDRVKPCDVVYTPEKIVNIMCLDIDPTETILDPCRGQGAFYEYFKNERKYYCEITEQKDFFDYKEHIDCIYGNPPYSILTQWLKHSFTIANKKVKYIIGMYSLTPARISMAEDHGFYLTDIILTQVPSWFQRSYIVTFEKLNSRPEKIKFQSLNLGNKCLYCGFPCGGMRGKNIKHCKRKMTDLICSY